MVKALTTKSTKTLIKTATVGDTVESAQKTILDTSTTLISAKEESDSTAAKVTKAISDNPVAAAIPTKAVVAKKTPLDSAVTEPDTMSESEQLRAAIAAGNAKNWDLAIEILERDGVFKAKNELRTLHLLNAYVESRRFDKAQAIMDATFSQDAYFHFVCGKFWYYRGYPDKAIKHFESVLNRSSIVDTDNVQPEVVLYVIADIKQERFKAVPTASNRSSALEAWREVRAVFILKPNDTRAKRAEREISALDAGN